MSKPVNIWFPTYIGDFFTVTASMTGHEVGAYQIIIATLWKAGGSIPADDRQLAKLVKASPRQWKEIKETLWPLFAVTDGKLTHPGTTDEIAKARGMSEKNAAAAALRWAKKPDANAVQAHSERNADGMRAHTERNANAMLRACDGEGEGEGILPRDDFGGEGITEAPFRVVGGGK